MNQKSPTQTVPRPRARWAWRWWIFGALLIVSSIPLARLAHGALLSYPSSQPYTQKEMRALGERGVNPGALRALNKLRELSGKRWTVLSAARSAKKNADVDGVGGSQHLHGRAFDLRVPHWARDDFYRHAKAAGFTAFGWGNGSVHVDTRKKRGDWWTYDDARNSRNVSGAEKVKYLYKAPESFLVERDLQPTGPQHRLRCLKWDLIALSRDLGL